MIVEAANLYDTIAMVILCKAEFDDSDRWCSCSGSVEVPETAETTRHMLCDS